MSNENSPQRPDEGTPDSAPKGAEVVSAPCDLPDIQPELLERIAVEARRVAVSVIKHEMHAGPMPAPKQLREYDAALPGTALIIRDEFQANGLHVRESEKRALEASIEDNRQNRLTAERLVFGAFVLILVLALAGHDTVGGIVAGTTVLAVITGFLKKGTSKKAQPAPSPDEE